VTRETTMSSTLEIAQLTSTDPRIAVLIGLLVLAAAIDVRQHRVPNALVLAGLCFAIAWNGLHPLSAMNGWAFAAAGCVVGFISLFPFYLLRAMGAGDVKLMAMVGAFVGPFGALCAALATFVAGGVLAIVVLACKRSLRRALSNVGRLLSANVLMAPTGSVDFTIASKESAGKLPYAVAIAGGTLGYLCLHAAGLVA
jgi:prepilin peptidase CpaA